MFYLNLTKLINSEIPGNTAPQANEHVSQTDIVFQGMLFDKPDTVSQGILFHKPMEMFPRQILYIYQE